MWRRVASQSPDDPAGPNRDYIKSYAAMNQMLREGRSLSGQERNCVFLNTGTQRFAAASAASGLDFPDDGRGVALVDWDFDGRMEMWMSNRTAPRVRFMKNVTPTDHNWLKVRLEGTTCNRDAIGARVELHVVDGPSRKFIRTLRAGEGFLSQSSKWIHFGLGPAQRIEKLVVRWPGGEAGEFTGLEPKRHYHVVQGSKAAQLWNPPERQLNLAPAVQQPHGMTNQSRSVLLGRLPMPEIAKTDVMNAISDEQRPTGPILVNLWATWCKPCLQELTEFAEAESRLRAAGVTVIALSVDELADDPQAVPTASKEFLASINFPFPAGAITPEIAGTLDIFHRAFFSLRRPLPLPSSFLVAPNGLVVAIYRGPVSVDQIIADVELVDMEPRELRRAAAPMPGRWHEPPFGPAPKQTALAFMREGYLPEGTKWLQSFLLSYLAGVQAFQPGVPPLPQHRLAVLCEHLADFYLLQEDHPNVLAAYRLALQFDPEFIPAHLRLGAALVHLGKPEEGARLLERASRLRPNHPQILNDLGIARTAQGNYEQAIECFRQSLAVRPDFAVARANLARALNLFGKHADAATELARIVGSPAESPATLHMLAWIRATSPDDAARDGAHALELARRLVAQQDGNPHAHDVLAAAEAEAGNFAAAVAAANRAIELARQSGESPLVETIGKRLALYQNGRAYREVAGP